MSQNTVRDKLNDANARLKNAHMSVTLQEGQVKDLLTLPGGKSALRNSVTVIGEEVTAGGVQSITSRPK